LTGRDLNKIYGEIVELFGSSTKSKRKTKDSKDQSLKSITCYELGCHESTV
jgi:hypothetical protein